MSKGLYKNFERLSTSCSDQKGALSFRVCSQVGTSLVSVHKL